MSDAIISAILAGIWVLLYYILKALQDISSKLDHYVSNKEE